MHIEVQHRPAYALAVVHLQPGETVVGEAGAMVSMDTHLKMETKAASKPDQGMMGALFSGLKRLVAGESFFQNRYTAEGRPGVVTFAPTLVGDIETYELAGKNLMIQSSSYLCSGPDVQIDTKWGGAKSFFGGEGLIMLKASGAGPIAFNSFGAIKRVDVAGDFTIDTGHIVAFEDTLKFTVAKFGDSWKSFLFGGEGLVCKFKGNGALFIQTRNPQAFGQLIGPLLPKRQA
ncbi:MAG: TIGR00266 family protein [Deltaproteobacteria bacterium]|nr:TIGR00266 family protein [Deltaproteobacteria bacterium]